MAMENKRITQLSAERLTLTSGDYVMVDDENNGSAKYRLDRLKETDNTLSVSGKAADAAATGQAISDEAEARDNADNALGEDIGDLKSAISKTQTSINKLPNGKVHYAFDSYKGWINGAGTIMSQNATNKQYYTSMVSVTYKDCIDYTIELSDETKTIWLAVALYDTVGNFIERVVLDDTSLGSCHGKYYIKNDIGYVRFTYNTYDLLENVDFMNTLNAEIEILSLNENEIYLHFDSYKGWINGAGAIMSQHATTKQYYTSDINTEPGIRYNYNLKIIGSSNIVWVAVATYDINNQFVERITLDDFSLTNCSGEFVVPDGVYTLRFTYATYGNALFYVCQETNVLQGLMTLDDGYVELSQSLLYPGIIGASGQRIGQDSVKKEFYTPFICVNSADVIKYSVKLKQDNSEGLSFVCFYNSAGFVKRLELNESTGSFIIPSGVTRFIFVTRLYTGGKIRLSKRIQRVSYNSATIKTIAHRGDPIFAPQCTKPAYIAAKHNGHSVAENDLMQSEDGVLVMWHDITLARLGEYLVDINGYSMYTNGTDYYWVDSSSTVYSFEDDQYNATSISVSSLTRCEGANYGVNSTFASVVGLPFNILKRIDFGIYKGLQFKGTQIMTFFEWVLLCKQLGLEIVIDRKVTFTEQLLLSAAETVLNLGMGEHSTWTNLEPSEITILRSVLPNAKVTELDWPTEALINKYLPSLASGKIAFNGNIESGMTSEAIQLGLSNGFDVEGWYVDYGVYTLPITIYTKIKSAVEKGLTALTLDHYHVEDAYEDMIDI